MKKCNMCDSVFTDDTDVCPNCGGELEEVASENAACADDAAEAESFEESTPYEAENFGESTPNEAEQPIKPKKSKAGLVIVIIIILAALGVGGLFLYKYLTKSPFEILAEKLAKLEDYKSVTVDIDGKLTTQGMDMPISGTVLAETNDKKEDVQMDFSAEVPMLGALDVSMACTVDLEKETAKSAASVMGETQAYSIDFAESDGTFDKLYNAKTFDESIDALVDLLYEDADEDLDKLDKEELKACIKKSLAYLNSRKALKEIWHYEKKDDVYSFDADLATVLNVFVENMKPAFKDAKDYEGFVADYNKSKDEYKTPLKMSFIIKDDNLTSLSISAKYENASASFILTVKDNRIAEMSFSFNDKESDTDVSLKFTCSDYNKTKVKFSDDMLKAFENAEEVKLEDIMNFGPNDDSTGSDDTGNTGVGEQTSDYELIARTACEQHLADYGKFAKEAYIAVYGYEQDWIIYEIKDERPVLVDDAKEKQDIVDMLFGESFDSNDMWTKSEGYANSDTVYWCVIESDKTCTKAFDDIADTFDALTANGITVNEGSVFVWKSEGKKRIFKINEGGSILIIANSLEDEVTTALEKVDTSDIEGASSKVVVFAAK